MAATASNLFAAPSPLAPMHPTMTEHDFRFPRRPADAATGARRPDRFDYGRTPGAGARAVPMPMSATPAATTATATAPNGVRLGPRQPMTHGGGAQHDLLRAAAFPPFQQSAAREAQSLEEMQRHDPLATQVWRFYARTKMLLPAQERMENLTWRMMHLKLQSTRTVNAAR